METGEAGWFGLVFDGGGGGGGSGSGSGGGGGGVSGGVMKRGIACGASGASGVSRGISGTSWLKGINQTRRR